MRSGLRQEVQLESRRPEQGQKAPLGVFEANQARNPSMPHDSHSQKENPGVQNSGCHGSTQETLERCWKAISGEGDKSRMSSALAKMLLAALWFYKKCISPWLPPACRFTPTCSEYAMEAVIKHGALKGSALAVWRLLRCQPFSKGGYDPVPEPSNSRQGPKA